MGGGLDHGNITPLAEFNIYVDPEAAKIIFQSDLPIVMSGLDVTEKAEITVDEIESLQHKGRVSHLAMNCSISIINLGDNLALLTVRYMIYVLSHIY